MPLTPGASFDRYVIRALLGHGGMGEVYAADDPRLQRTVALKIVRAGEGSAGSDQGSPGGAARILREARAAAAINHPNAVAIFDVGEVDGVAFLAMELIEGRTLRPFIGDPAVSVATRVGWLVDVARALAAAHERGVVHRDIKPENVMVRSDGVVKVLDFGIARRRAPDLSDTDTLTQQGTRVGTPLYMAPEQIRGVAVDARADQFAWALVAYELLAGRHPWAVGRDALATVAAMLGDAPPRVLDHAPELPPQVAATIERALAKSPEGRFPSMLDLIDALSPPVAASARAASSRRPVEPPPSPFATTRALTHALESAPSKPPASHPSRRPLVLGALALVASLAAAGALVAKRAPSRDLGSSASASASASASSPTLITSAPPPDTPSPEAVAPYTSALQLVRDGSFSRAREELERALAIDPALAAAHLRYVTYVASVYSAPLAPTRAHLQAAIAGRARLSPRDQAILDALGTIYLGNDDDASTSRLAELRRAYPDDAEVAFLAFSLGDDPSAFDRAVALDPGFAAPWFSKAARAAARGDADGALAACDRCLATSRYAASCLMIRARLHAQRGECADAGDDANAALLLDAGSGQGSEAPASIGSYRAYDSLANALVARGKTTAAVREVLKQKWAATSASARDLVRATDEGLVAAYEGDFDASLRALDGADALLAAEGSELRHVRMARARIDLLLETDRVADAADYAARFLRARDGWRPARAVDYDVRPLLYALEVRAGRLPRPERERLRAAVLDEWSREPPEPRGWMWIMGWALPSLGPDDAREALATFPDASALPRFARRGLPDYEPAKVLALAGDRERALPLLRRVVADCEPLDTPRAHLLAEVWLGDALAAAGDKAGACDAYARVVERWGAAKPRSTTAEMARRAARSLACPAAH